MVLIKTSLMFLIILVCQLFWLSSSSFVNPNPFGDTVGCHCNGVVNDIGQFGKCMVGPSGTLCHVNKDSGCKDIIESKGQFLSTSPCKSEHGQQEDRKETTTTTTTTSGLLISGGYGGKTSVEMFVPSTNLSCKLPSLPDNRHRHTMSGMNICGGKHTGTTAATTCLRLSSGMWSVSHTLTQERLGHSSWESDQGVVLLGGGGDSALSSEVVGQGGVAFDMKYSTMSACAISDGDSVLLTGGYYSKQRVSRYDATGYVSDLPRLNEGRFAHGCGAYLRQDGTQVFLVAGGYGADNPLSSTELMVEGSDAWTMSTPLPRAVRGVRGATLGNIVYMTGGSRRAEILAWSVEGKDWEEVGKMKVGRYYHAITTISVEEVAAFCD